MWSWDKIVNTVVPLLAAAVAYLCVQPHLGFNSKPDSKAIWWRDFETSELRHRPQCRDEEFSLAGMSTCHKWLSCENITNDVHIQRALYSGVVKKVNLAKWQTHDVVVSELANSVYREDFKHGLQMLLMYQPIRFVVQLLGFCNDTIVTQYHRFGSADNVNQLLSREISKKHNTLQTRFRLCLDYVEIINFLHTGPLGTRVMCDSNDLQKTLSQYLLTDDFHLVVNDLDALPEVDHEHGIFIKCGHRELMGDFVAPEQRWPYLGRDFSDKDMPRYDKKVDIWKIPDVCDHFLGDVAGSDSLRFKLFKIHKVCKETDPVKRPTALQVLQYYEELYANL